MQGGRIRHTTSDIGLASLGRCGYLFIYVAGTVLAVCSYIRQTNDTLSGQIYRLFVR